MTTISFPLNPASAATVIDDLLTYATSLRASDIHCDPREIGTVIRLRVDGQIGEVGVLPKRLHEEFIARLKILSGARTDLHTAPQDGRWRTSIRPASYLNATSSVSDEVNIENDANKTGSSNPTDNSSTSDYNIRISFMPTYHGENAVLRLLPTKVPSDISFAKLGFTPDHVRAISNALERKHGLILVTGPTGSGKTTTLHTCLSLKAREPLSIITLEDPVEYEIAGVRQIHIRHSHGVTFASGLRAALRQDPDVIMVGEIRDNETAQVAIHTALTGHLVLSTLHTNSALETIPRLVDMGIDHYLLASTLKLVVAQRLVRATCQECNAAGCMVCRQTGYSGRSIIAEACEIDDGFTNLIARKESVSAYLDYALSRGFRPIREDGMEKIEWGVTTKEEVLNVLHA